MSNKIILTVGNIASGKSTWCKEQAERGIIVVCNDDITTMIHGGVYNYNKELKPIYKSIEIAAVTSALTAGKTVIVDRMNQTAHQRRKWVGIASAFDVPCWAVIFPRDTPEDHASRRFKHDPRGKSYKDWLKVANHFEETYEDINISLEGIEMVCDANSDMGPIFTIGLKYEFPTKI